MTKIRKTGRYALQRDRHPAGSEQLAQKKIRSARPVDRIALIDKDDPDVSIRTQCQLLGITRSRLYYEPVPEPPETKRIMDTLDEIYMLRPFFGVRRMKDELNDRGFEIGTYRTRSLLRRMGLTAVFPKPDTSRPHPLHPVYPYLLRDVEVRRNNQVWSADITYIKLSRGWAYLVAIIDWHSRYVLSWRLSNTLDAGFCVEALEEALAHHEKPDIFNTDQGCQFTSQDFTGVLIREGISISMDGRGRALDNVFIERLWRSVKYEDVLARLPDDR